MSNLGPTQALVLSVLNRRKTPTTYEAVADQIGNTPDAVRSAVNRLRRARRGNITVSYDDNGTARVATRRR